MSLSTRRLLTLCLGAALLGAAVFAQQTGPPDIGPSDAAMIRRWTLDLRDADPGVRAEAVDRLMGLRRSELPLLRAVIAELGDALGMLRPQLRQVVTHVYLSEEPYERDERFGFLGMLRSSDPLGAEGAQRIVVDSRMPGFGAYRALRDGDVILELEERPLAQPLDWNQFAEAIKAVRPGTTIHLRVLRGGEVIRRAVVLDARPADPTPLDPEAYTERVRALLSQRLRRAQEYIAREFPLLLDEAPSAPQDAEGGDR